MRAALHEEFSHKTETKGSSDRSFGLVFAAFFTLVALAPLRHGGSIRLWAVVLAALFLAVSIVRASLLSPLNRLWLKLGLLLGKIVNPIVMGLVFFVVVVPTALLFRLQGKDKLRLKADRSAKSYWIVRTPPGPSPESMANQF